MNFFQTFTVPVPGTKFNEAVLIGGAARLGGDDLKPAPVAVVPVHPLPSDLCLLPRMCSGQQVTGVVLLVGTVA